jgi:hypothetical protein
MSAGHCGENKAQDTSLLGFLLGLFDPSRISGELEPHCRCHILPIASRLQYEPREEAETGYDQAEKEKHLWIQF